MDSATCHDTSSPTEDANAGEPEAQLDNIDALEGVSSSVDIMRELGSAGEVLTRLELHLACFSEKLVNMNIFMMHVATRESEFEDFFSKKEQNFSVFAKIALEFDLLSGILDSEVRELEFFMSTLQTEIVNAREIISSCEHLAEDFKEMEVKFHDSEESLTQLLEQVSEIRVQSDNFLRILLSFNGEENWKDKKYSELLENGDSSDRSAKIKMQTAEEQRLILRMLEKTLARELDLETKADESRKIEEDLKLRLHSSEQEVFCMEEDTVVVWERLFEADNTAEVLMGISKELLGRLQILQFNLNGSVQREGELRSKLQDSIEQVKSKDSALQRLGSSSAELNDFLLSQSNTLKAGLGEMEDKFVIADSEAFTLREKVSLLEKQLKESEFHLMNAQATADGSQDLHSEIQEMGNVIEDLKEKISKAESRAESAESKCKLLTETNMELNEELTSLKSRGNTSDDRVGSLERQLKKSDIQLHHAVASVEASQEKQSMLDSTIKDMENLIEGLKSKVSKAERQAESAEEKCITLSESNSDLNEELNFLRDRMESLEVSLRQSEETKKATAKDISIRTKLITDLVMQLALERERLQKQISSLRKENKILVKHLQQTIKGPESPDSKGFLLSKQGFTTATYLKESKEETAELSASSLELNKMPKKAPESETEMGLADSESILETTRNIDARELNFKYVSIAVVVLVISVLASFLFQQQKGQV